MASLKNMCKQFTFFLESNATYSGHTLQRGIKIIAEMSSNVTVPSDLVGKGFNKTKTLVFVSQQKTTLSEYNNHL